MLERIRQPLDGMAPAGVRIECRPIPSDDAAFADTVRECQARLPVAVPHALRRLLRERYPRATVSVQTDLARVDGTWVWYVYRDGGA